ncbi:hypothetical protein ACIGNX_27225 [Actinosynnema sp. NPDC053489]|uniref:hypothetical protein n=1 Tax=Actinosynnema sp. NPDC053489 TaxID=3363916 RepID=UPI0037C89DB3
MRDPFGTTRWTGAVVEEVSPEVGLERLAEPARAEAMHDAQATPDRELTGRADGTAGRPRPGRPGGARPLDPVDSRTRAVNC